ncbi:MAG: SDR family oxidoreductase [Nitrospirales bacterium]|nr:SDR family oxidoreductase [Nitrospirales bacterium]
MQLQGKVAVITGAGRGLGRASAIAMAREGASVVIVSRTAVEIKETACLAGSYEGVIPMVADVSSPLDVAQVLQTTLSELGRIDILMNNAAVIGPVKPLHQVEEREWESALGINLKAIHFFSRAVIPFMARQGGGKIINVTSGLGEIAMPLFGLYSIAKAGVIHLTKIMAQELKDMNIQVNGLDPGVMDTRMQEEIRGFGPKILGEELHSVFVSLKEEGHLKDPAEAARLALFLASPESDDISGENGTEEHYRRLGYT